MGFGDIFKTIGNLAKRAGAPILASAIPGGGIAMDLVKSVFKIDPDENDEKLISKIIETDPLAAVKFKQIEIDHKLNLEKIAFERDELATKEYMAALDDKQSARNREMILTKELGSRDINLYVLAWVVVVGFFSTVMLMVFHPIPDESLGPINQLFGALVIGFGMVLSYFFGSSVGSRKKDTQIAGTKVNGR